MIIDHLHTTINKTTHINYKHTISDNILKNLISSTFDNGRYEIIYQRSNQMHSIQTSLRVHNLPQVVLQIRIHTGSSPLTQNHLRNNDYQLALMQG